MLPVNTWLQWSRDVIVAVAISPSGARLPLDALQWSRDVIVAVANHASAPPRPSASESFNGAAT